MKKIYCRKCGYKVLDTDTEYCPRCGNRLNDYNEVQKIEKSRKTRRILLIALAIVIILTLLIISSAVIMNNNPNEFKRVNMSSTCSLELPNIHFDVQNNSFGGSYGSYSSQSTSRFLTSSKVSVMYIKTVDNSGLSISGVDNINGNFNTGNTNIYSRDVINYETGESIHVQGEDKELVDRVADSVVFSKDNGSGNNTTDSNHQSNGKNIKNINTSSNQKKYYDNFGNEISKEEFEKNGGYNAEYMREKSEYYNSPEYQEAVAEANSNYQGGGSDQGPIG